MSKTVPEKIEEALRSGPISSMRREGVDPESGRLVAGDLSTAERVSLFRERAESSGAEVHIVEDPGALMALFRELLPENATVAVACGGQLEERLGVSASGLVPSSCRLVDSRMLEMEDLFEVDVAVTDVDLGIAETGSIVVGPGAGYPRRLSLVAETHIALIGSDQIVSDLLDWTGGPKNREAGGITLITGPSKTADIELKLVVGVHGPARLHLIVV